jgi:hypothetical protein
VREEEMRMRKKKRRKGGEVRNREKKTKKGTETKRKENDSGGHKKSGTGNE